MSEWAQIASVSITAAATVVCEMIRRRPPTPILLRGGHKSQQAVFWEKARNLSLGLFAASIVVSFVFWFFPRGTGLANNGVENRITVTETPPADPLGGPQTAGHRIEGFVSGVTPADFRIVIYAHTTRWYVQPEATSPMTGITSDGKWESDIRLGDRYAVLLVKPSYLPPRDFVSLPGVGGDIVYLTTVKGK